MGLQQYYKKRDFKKTAEPKGKVHARKKAALRFVIQKHDATRLHYDFRLEIDGVLKSWAVPKGPSLDPSKKSLAVQVEDHPIEYGSFEGIIPKGQYGGGTVLLWDTGTWEPYHDALEGWESGHLHFKLDGHKLKGDWNLVRMHGRRGDEEGKNWLLMKLKDKYASTTTNITADKPKSVASKRTLEKIAKDADAVWNSNRSEEAVEDRPKKVAKKAKSKKSAKMPNDLRAQLALLADHAPVGDEWLHEIKFDGYRILAKINGGKVELITRNDNSWTDKFKSIADALEGVDADSAVLDGEVVVLDDKGRSDFAALQGRMKHKTNAPLDYYVFDLLFLNGEDLRELPLIERKTKLEKLLKASKLPASIHYSDHVRGDGTAVANRACDMSLEGVISKRADAPYVGRRDGTWIKSKCDHRQEMIIIGYTDPQGSRKGFGAILLGYYDDEGHLKYAGRCGTGFDEKLLGDLLKQFKAIGQKSTPTDDTPPARERKNAHWLKPKLVAEIRFTGWTPDGMLRHPAFIGIRADKHPGDVHRETAIHIDAKKPTKVPAAPAEEGAGTTRKSKASKKGVASSKDASVAGVRLSHPDKVLYPDCGVTKRQLAEYYEAAAKWAVPHIAGRPLALKRCPGGAGEKCFFQRNYTDVMPKAIHGVDVSETKKPEPHITLDGLEGIISLVQLGVLEIHTWGCKNNDIEHPDQLIFDLDPAPDVKWKTTMGAARILKKTLDGLKLPTFLKTSGGKGLHLTIPIKPNIDWDTAKDFTGTIVESLAKEHPDLFVANMRKDLRGGKIYIDYHRNGRSATAVAPYSSRAREGAPVSMPISWEELGKLSSAAHFTVDTASRHLKQRKVDPWRDFESARVDLRKIITD